MLSNKYQSWKTIKSGALKLKKKKKKKKQSLSVQIIKKNDKIIS